MENNKEIIHESEVKELIIELRGEKVLIDRDVAKLYGVETSFEDETYSKEDKKRINSLILRRNEVDKR